MNFGMPSFILTVWCDRFAAIKVPPGSKDPRSQLAPAPVLTDVNAGRLNRAYHGRLL